MSNLSQKEKERQEIEKTMVQRAQKSDDKTDGQTKSHSMTDKETIMAYVREHSIISNPECRELLSVDRHRATYLLQKIESLDICRNRGTTLRIFRFNRIDCSVGIPVIVALDFKHARKPA